MTDEISKIFVGLIIEDRLDDGTRIFLAVPSTWLKNPTDKPIIKFPGGMHKVTDKDFWATARREGKQEVGFFVPENAPHRLLTDYKFDDQRKYFFLVERRHCRGRVRHRRIVDGDSLLELPKVMTLEELKSSLYRTHQPILPPLEGLN